MDQIYALGGNDSVQGSGGADLIKGNLGTDFLKGGSEDDEMYGGEGNDTAGQATTSSSVELATRDSPAAKTRSTVKRETI